MIRSLNRLFNVRAKEWPRLLLLMLMLFLMVAGNTWGQITAYAGFVNAVGANAVPGILAAAAVLAIILAAGYSLAADRIADDRLLIFIGVGAVVSIGIGRFLLQWDSLALIAYPLLYVVYSVVVLRVLNVHWWTYVNSFYDTRAAKRIVPLVAVSARLGGSMALLIPFIRQWLAPRDMILLWLLLLAAVAVLAWAMPYLLGESRQTNRSAHISQRSRSQDHASYLDNLREGFRYTSGSPFMRRMALAILLMTILLELHWFQQTSIMDANVQPGGVFGSPAALESMLGSVIGITSILLIPVQLFLLPRLINRLGVGNANLLFPLLTLVLSAALIFYGIGPELLLLTWPAVMVAALADINRIHVRAAFQAPVDSLLYNAVPLRFKGRARAFVNGLLVPLAVLVSSALVLGLKDVAIGWLLPLLMGLLALGYGAAAWAIRQQYGQALIDLLEQEDYSSLLPEETIDLAGPLTLTDPAALAKLREKLAASQDPDVTVFMARLLIQVGGAQAVPLLAEAMQQRSGPMHAHMRATLIAVLLASDLHGAEVDDLLRAALADESGAVRREALAGLKRLSEVKGDDFLPLAAHYVADPDVGVRGVVLPPLLQSPASSQRQLAETAVSQLLQSDQVAERTLAVEALGQTEDVAFLPRILTHLADEADEVRLAAAVVVETLCHDPLPDETAAQVAHHIEARLDDPVERVRQAALIILGRLRRPQTYLAVAQHLHDPSPAIRQLAADVLVGLGKGAVPVVHPQLDAADSQLRKMAAIVLSRINPREYGPLISTHIVGNLLHIYTNHLHLQALRPLAKFPAVVVLKESLQEQNGRLTAEIFDLLLALHESHTINLVQESLNSQVDHVQANALEALETLTSPQISQLMAPLFMPHVPDHVLLHLAHSHWEMDLPDLPAAFRTLAVDSPDSWLRTTAVYALGEMGRTLGGQATGSETTGSPQPTDARPKRRPRRSAASLLDELAPEPANETPPPATPPAAAGEEAEAPLTDATRRRQARQQRMQHLMDMLADEPETAAVAADAEQTLLIMPSPLRKQIDLAAITALLAEARRDAHSSVRQTADMAWRMVAAGGPVAFKEGQMLSVVERIVFLKEVSFFQGMTVDQLRVLANVCEEELFAEDTAVYREGEPGGVLYVIVRGRVAIEREGRRRGSVARLDTVGAHASFGDMNLFDDSPRTASAVALEETLVLKLRREPLIALARQYPELSLALINVLSQRLRQTTERVAELTRTQPRELHKLFDQLD
ncbi:MAG: HEAT repeat domain-containing protein [Chloroflexota bacterium]